MTRKSTVHPKPSAASRWWCRSSRLRGREWRVSENRELAAPALDADSESLTRFCGKKQGAKTSHTQKQTTASPCIHAAKLQLSSPILQSLDLRHLVALCATADALIERVARLRLHAKTFDVSLLQEIETTCRDLVPEKHPQVRLCLLAVPPARSSCARRLCGLACKAYASSCAQRCDSSINNTMFSKKLFGSRILQTQAKSSHGEDAGT